MYAYENTYESTFIFVHIFAYENKYESTFILYENTYESTFIFVHIFAYAYTVKRCDLYVHTLHTVTRYNIL